MQTHQGKTQVWNRDQVELAKILHHKNRSRDHGHHWDMLIFVQEDLRARINSHGTLLERIPSVLDL